MKIFKELLNASTTFDKVENIQAWLFWLAKMEQNKDTENNDAQLQHDMEAIDALIAIINKLPGKYGPDKLQIILNTVYGDATPEEKRQFDEWASLSAENRSWLEQFCDREWLQEQSIIHKNIDIEERSKTFRSMVTAQQTQQEGKVLSIIKSIAKIAAVLIVVLTGTYFFVSSEKKTNQQSAVLNSTGQQRGYTTASVDSFGRSGIYTLMSTNEAANEPLYQKLPIPPEGYAEVQLPDGTRVWLSSTTTFIYPLTFTGNKRKVEITGEAYFEVDSNAAMPFLAIVNGVHIETIGGCFNVKAHEQEALKKVTVLQGAVRVAAGPYEVLLKENQSALVEKKKRIAIELNEDTGKVMAWKDKRFLFINDSLAIVTRELARRYNLVLTGNINSDAKISYGGSRLEPVETVLAKMQQGNRNFLYKIEGRVLTIEKQIGNY